jgi:hypothetical protein
MALAGEVRSILHTVMVRLFQDNFRLSRGGSGHSGRSACYTAVGLCDVG